MMPFQTNLSLVVSQTQEVHEEIADLLDQLRRLQDLQVTIEVRFITLTMHLQNVLAWTLTLTFKQA